MLNRLFKKKKQEQQKIPKWLEIFQELTKDRDSCCYDISLLNNDAPKKEDVIQLESMIKYKFPAEFASFLVSPYSGLYVGVKCVIWDEPKEVEIRPAWAFQSAITTFSISEVIPWEFNLRYWHQEMFLQHKIDDLLPIMARNGTSIKYCLNPEGNLVEWDSDYPEDKKELKESFFDLLANELTELDSRRTKFQNGEHLKGEN